MWSVTQKSLSYSMFNVFLHPHVHRWPSNEEKICLWICLTPVECNCILIWAQGKTSVHSAAGNPTSHSIVFIQLSFTHNQFTEDKCYLLKEPTASSAIMWHCITSTTYIDIFKTVLISAANKLSTSGPQPLRATKRFAERKIRLKFIRWGLLWHFFHTFTQNPFSGQRGVIN